MKKKLIEVALPLEAINKESAREKSIRHGHPSTLHLWWARRPLAACRAILFASLVDDPSSLPEKFPTEADQDAERQRLFRLIEKLVVWENSNNRVILDAAYQEIFKSTNGNPPAIYDPFCGGGSIPLEAQRLGLKAYGSDLNPVAVLITKALVELPPKFAGQPPVNPAARLKMSGKGMWIGARGLADDIRYYGQWMRDRAFERIGHLYPRATLPEIHGGGKATVIAWILARTVLCPNPACVARMPVVRSFALSTKKNTWIEPVIDHVSKQARFKVHTGEGIPPEGTKLRGSTRCLFCGNTVNDRELREQSKNHGLTVIPLATVVESKSGRVYLPLDNLKDAETPCPPTPWLDQPLPDNARWFSPPGYGLSTYRDLFTPRQVVALSVFSDLVTEAQQQALHDGSSYERATAIATFLAFSLDKCTDYWNSIATWASTGEFIRNCFARQAIPMTWDFCECNPFSDSTANWSGPIEWVAKVLDEIPLGMEGHVRQLDATVINAPQKRVVFSTDPPYYDNIGYADLSDFFYVWLRRSLGAIYPDICSTLLVPKKQELVATPYRFNGSRAEAQAFFEDGFSKAFGRMRLLQDPEFPLAVYYAFKQSESESEDDDGATVGHASTGWETMLEGLLSSGFQVTATWPSRSERPGRSISIGTNALASSIVLSCRSRPEPAAITTRKHFLSMLKSGLPKALRNLQKGNIAPVDLAQAAIGPGMSIFSQFGKVLETDGSPMRVRTALELINQGLDEVLSEMESEFDPDTRWALAWFEQYQFEEAAYGQAELLATAKAISVSHLAGAGIVHSRAQRVRLTRRDELPENWEPLGNAHLTVWLVTQHLIRSLDMRGEKETANLKASIGGMADSARDLAYRLYVVCERKGWAEEAGFYNSLVVAWPSMESQSFELK